MQNQTTRARISLFCLVVRTLVRSVLVGVGGALLAQALLVRHALEKEHEKKKKISEGLMGGEHAPHADADGADGASGGSDGGSGGGGGGGGGGADSHSQHHRGWLVLVWASAAPTPPDKPDKGERAFATLVNGTLKLARDRRGPTLECIDLEGCEMHLCATPVHASFQGAASPGGVNDDDGDDDDDEGEGEGEWHPKVDHKGAEKRWFKRLPFVLSHPTRPLFRGYRVVWCYALSDPAKEVRRSSRIHIPSLTQP